MGSEFIGQVIWGMSKRREDAWIALATTFDLLTIYMFPTISVLWYFFCIALWGLINLWGFEPNPWLVFGIYIFLTWIFLYVFAGFLKRNSPKSL